jgi:hypothetical protein
MDHSLTPNSSSCHGPWMLLASSLNSCHLLNFKEKARDNGWNEISVLIDEVVTYI